MAVRSSESNVTHGDKRDASVLCILSEFRSKYTIYEFVLDRCC
jgi:hypothetical protein